MGLLLAETPPFKFFQDTQGWNSLDTAEIRGIKNVGIFQKLAVPEQTSSQVTDS